MRSRATFAPSPATGCTPVHNGEEEDYSVGKDFGNSDSYQDYRGILNSYSQTQASLDMR